MHERQLYLAWSDSLGGYGKIREFAVRLFVLLVGRFTCTHDLLNLWRFLFQIKFLFWWNINMDNALLDIIA